MTEQLENNLALEVSEETNLPLSEEVTTKSEDHMMSSNTLEDEHISSESGASELLPETLVLPIQESHIDVPAASRCPPEMAVGNPEERSSPTIVHEPQEETSPESSPPTAKRAKYSAKERAHGSCIQHIVNVFRENVFENSIVNVHGPKLSDDHSYTQPYEMSCQSPVDPKGGCRFSATFQKTAYKILTILEESKKDKYVYFIAIGLSGPNPLERVFKEIEKYNLKSLEEVFKHYTGRGRWNWMDFDSLDYLLVQAEKELDPDEHDEKECLNRAMGELQKYRDKLWGHLDSRLMPLREDPLKSDPPKSDLLKSDPGYFVRVKDMRDEYNITPRLIIEYKEKLARSLKIGLELFSIADIYGGCTTIWFEIHSEVTSENVKQALLRKGGTEECTEDEHSVVTLYFEDYHVEEVKIREHVTAVVTEKCKQHGARPMETSEIEYRRNLEGKYFSDAEESEIICDLADEGESERLALRPDLTIPFARYLADKKQDNLKRYEVGKVYSRAKNGKETIQIDFDIAGQFDLMTSDAECLRLLSEVLTALHLDDFIIRVNHLSLQKGILTASGVSQEQLPAVLSCIRKFEDVHEDLVALGLPYNVVEKVVGYLKVKGDHKVVDELKRNEVLMMVDIVRESLAEIEQLLTYCAAFEIHDKVHIDLGLPRVYDYYTGVVFRASVIDGPSSEICLSRGGRYDDLVDKFCDGFKVPCVGFTFDLLTIADLMWRRQIKSEVLQTLQSEENATSDLHTVTEMDTTSEVLPVPAKVEAISRNVEVMTIEDDSQLNDEVEESMSCISPLKTPKGMRDYNPHDMMLRSKIIKSITAVYKKHGAVTIDTPALELKEVLKGKYGEESKLIYDLENQGGETQSLRYDLTVPFARYLATNRKHYMKRYQIDKVYRRDKPSIRQGRCREMYQCDFDIAGDYDLMLPDAECIRIVSEILTLPELGLGDIVIKVNHRKLLDGMFEACGVPGDKFRTICSAVDKLDKDSWENVREEMLSKGLSPEVADRVYDYVGRRSEHKLLEKLQKDPSLASVPAARQGLEELLLLLEYCKAYGVIDKVMVDLSLARGLDYYTGVIFEAKLLKGNEEEMNFGSLCGGGRYDDLVASFDPKGQFKVPCVGFSIGLERIFNILESRIQKDSGYKMRTVETEVYVVTGQKDMLTDRMSLCTHLWDHGIKTEMSYKANPKMLTQFQYCEREGIPFQVIIGEEEKEHGSVKIRDTVTKDEVLVKREVVAHHLKNALIRKGYTQPSSV